MISCIIPAYNEEKTIASVLSVVTGYGRFEKVIVVDDGSTDRTPSILCQWRNQIDVLRHECNLGKKDAVATGLDHATSPYILFIDADLIDLTHQDLDHLIRPVIDKWVDLTFSLRSRSDIYGSYSRFLGIDLLTGERCGRRMDFLAGYTQGPNGYAIELLFNEYILATQLRFRVVPIQAYAMTKVQKVGWRQGLANQFNMMIDILRASHALTFFKQALVMPLRMQQQI